MNLLTSNSEVDVNSGAVLIKRNRKPDRRDLKIKELERKVSFLEKRVNSLSRAVRTNRKGVKRYAIRNS